MAGTVFRMADIMKSGVFVTKDRVKKVLGAIATLPQQDVLVGVPGDTSDRSGEITNAALAYIHDQGAPEANIPARPFMRPGIADAKDAIAEQFKRGGQSVLKGNAGGMERALHAAGLTASSAVKKRITTGPFIPLAASTIAARRRKGFSGTKPLIRTGQMRNAITYVVRKNTKPTVIR